MLAIDIVLSGLILGGTYALVAIGLTLQYGVARIMNLAYGELLVAAAFGAYWLFTANAISPIAGLLVIVPAAFAVNWLIYALLLTPLVRRAKSREALEADSILATFGMLFVVQGTLLVLFGGQYYSDRYLQSAVVILGDTVEANKLVAAAFAIVVSVGLYLGLTHTRAGTAVRAVAVAPGSARLVGIDVHAHLGLRLCARRRSVGRRRRARLDVAPVQRLERRPLHHEGADRRHHGRRREPPRRARRRPDPRHSPRSPSRG